MNLSETIKVRGAYSIICIAADGSPLWDQYVDNLVVTVGKNLLLDAPLSGSSYTVTGPYMGLISSVGCSAIAATDTLTSHPGWLEAGNAHLPTYSGTRANATFAAASGGSKSLASQSQFVVTGGGTVQGIFIAFGTGATNVIDATTGVLLTAAALTTPQPVLPTNIVLVSYTISL